MNVSNLCISFSDEDSGQRGLSGLLDHNKTMFNRNKGVPVKYLCCNYS